MQGFISDEEADKLTPEGFISDEEVDALTPSSLESGTRGLVQGGSLGFADELTGGVEALWEKAKGNPETFGNLYAKARDESRQNYKAAQAANPISYGTGELTGMVGTAFIPGLNAATGAKVAASLPALGATGAKLAAAGLQGAAQGALAGAGNTEKSLASAGGLQDAALGGAIGAAGGAAGSAIGDLASRGANKVGSLLGRAGTSADEGAEILAARALGGDESFRAAGRQALDEGVISPMANTSTMLNRNQALQNKIVSEGVDTAAFDTANVSDKLLRSKAAEETAQKGPGLIDSAIGATGLATALSTQGASIPVAAATYGAKKYGEKFGAQTGAVAMNNIGKILEQAPQAFGKFAPVLQNAAQRGTQSLAATHFILQQTQPEYQETIKSFNEGR